MAYDGMVTGKLKTSYRASSKSLRPIYTGGPVLVTDDGEWLISTLGDEVLISEIEGGRHIAKVKGDGTPITALSISYHTSPPTLLTAHQSLTIRYYPLPSPTLLPLPSTSSSTPSTPYLTYSRQITRAHPSPILILHSTPTSSPSQLFASGSADGLVKLWDSQGGFTTHLFRSHGGPISSLLFHFPTTPDAETKGMELITGCADSKIRIFDLLDPSHRSGTGGKPKSLLEGHNSVVRALSVSSDGRFLISGGRDSIGLVWDLLGDLSLVPKHKKSKPTTHQPKVVQTLLAHEPVESLGLLPVNTLKGELKGRLVAFTGGEKGVVRLWDVLKGKVVGSLGGVGGVDEDEDMEKDEEEEEDKGLYGVLYNEQTNTLISIHHDQNILLHSLSTPTILSSGLSFPLTRQIIGFNDEIIDSAFLTSSTHLALATNSSLIRMYNLTTSDSRLLRGHSDVVLCLAAAAGGDVLVSGSKDKSARLWRAGRDGEEWGCFALCLGHAESIGAVVMSKVEGREGKGRFMVTGSQDRTVKMWDLSSIPLLGTSSATPATPKSLATLRVHEKDINSLDLSPNDAFLATGSQDKLVKIFGVDYSDSGKLGAAGGFRLLGTCKGHKRGVWSVKFSGRDRVLLSGGADRTVRMWGLDDFTCLKTFEGHTNSVLRVDWLSQGQQIVSSASDGLVKIWNVKEEECMKTLDGHEDKVWALAISQDEKTIISGGADSVVNIWEDCSAEEEREEMAQREKVVAEEQDFNNYLHLKDYRRAIQLALAMSQPGRLLALFTTVSKSRSSASESSDLAAAADIASVTGSASVDEVIKTLAPLDLVRLLKFVRDWNARAKTSGIAQIILHAVLRLRTPTDIQEMFEKVQRSQIVEKPVDLDSDDEREAAEAEKKKPRTGPTNIIGLKDLMDGLIPYTERHFARVDRLMVDSYMLDYMVGEMDGGMLGGEVMEI